MTESEKTKHPGVLKWEEARIMARIAYPEYAAAIFSLTVVNSPECETAAVDGHGRIYFAPDFIAELPLEEAAGVWIHEVSHVLRKHRARSIIIGSDATEELAYIANICKDAVIHEDMQNDGRLPIPSIGVTLEKLGLEPGKTWEEHFIRILNDMPMRQKVTGMGGGDEQDGDGQGKDSKIGGPGLGNGNCGSGASGREQPWELGAPTEDSGMSEPEIEEVLRKVAQEIQDRAKSRGNVPGHMQRWASTVLTKRINPVDKIRQMLTQMVAAEVSGSQDRSYSRMSRRQQSATGGVLFPGTVGYVPEVEIVFDTSGSMSDRELSLGATAIAPILRELGGKCRLTSGDTQIEATEIIRKVGAKVGLGGGGGTNMAVILDQIRQRKVGRPNIVVLITDCETPWPTKPIREFKVLVLAMRDDRVPAWMKKIDCSSLLKEKDS
jgi:predicted metal-dependent peptidase